MNTDELKNAIEGKDWTAVIELTSGSNHVDVQNMWARAMTAKYGPVGTHASRLGTDGCPTAETLAEFPEIAQRMSEAAEGVSRAFGSYMRWLARR